jgi:hypothetical protein
MKRELGGSLGGETRRSRAAMLTPSDPEKSAYIHLLGKTFTSTAFEFGWWPDEGGSCCYALA